VRFPHAIVRYRPLVATGAYLSAVAVCGLGVIELQAPTVNWIERIPLGIRHGLTGVVVLAAGTALAAVVILALSRFQVLTVLDHHHVRLLPYLFHSAIPTHRRRAVKRFDVCGADFATWEERTIYRVRVVRVGGGPNALLVSLPGFMVAADIEERWFALQDWCGEMDSSERG